MITFPKSRIEYGDEITAKKIDALIVLFETPTKGKLNSHLMTATKQIETVKDEDGNETEKTIYQMGEALRAATKSWEMDFFTGKDILADLHEAYITELEAANPNVEFTSTL